MERRRELIFLVVGVLLGAGLTAGGFFLLDDDEPADRIAGDDSELGTTVPTIDPTDTEFGQLTERAEEEGVRVQWTAELREGDGAGTVEFVTAHRAGTTAFIVEGLRIVEDAQGVVTVCEGGSCGAGTVDDAAAKLPAAARPFYRIIRLTSTTTASPDYQITGETEIGDGIFQRCGQFDPTAFDIVLPEGVALVTQCIDVNRNVPLAVDLVGTQASVGTAGLDALADALPEDFATD